MEMNVTRELDKWGRELDGIFSFTDLEIIYRTKSRATLSRMLTKLCELGELTKVKNGLYAQPGASLPAIANRMYPESYISIGTVLAKNLVIGSVPAKRVQVIKVGTPRVFTCAMGTIEFLSIDPKLFFGFAKKDGINWASSEKAFLDACYFQYKGKRFSFNLTDDVDLMSLNFETLKRYLKVYDQRFITYFKRHWSLDGK